MLYSIISEDVPNSAPLRAKVRQDHITRLEQLLAAGRLVLAGPHPAIDSNDPGPAGFTGSLVVGEFDSIEDAQHWADADPYIHGGVYQHSTVKPFKLVLP